MDAAYVILLEEYTRQGVPLLEAIKQNEHLRAGGVAALEQGRPAAKQEQVAPSAAILAELARWNEAG